MNRKMYMSGLSIVSALALMGGAAFAQFPATASAANNNISTSTAGLELCTDDGSGTSPATDTTGEPCGGSIASPINISDLVPGSSATSHFWLYNNGSGTNDTIGGLTAIFSSVTGSGTGNGNLETALDVQIACDNTDTTAIAAFNAFEKSGQTFNPGSLASGTYSRCTVTASLPSNSDSVESQLLNFSTTINGSIGS